MPYRRLLRASALALVAVLVVAGLGYAAVHRATSGTVAACANAKHRLQVPQRNGTCPSGYHKITLNRTGPRGPAGPGAWAVQAEAASGSAFRDRSIAGLHLTAHVVCLAGDSSAVYLLQDGTTVQSTYHVGGTASLAPGSSGSLVYFTGTIQHPALSAGGPQLLSFDADYNGAGAASEIVLDSGTATADLVVSRGTARAAVHVTLSQDGGPCLAQAVVTPLT